MVQIRSFEGYLTKRWGAGPLDPAQPLLAIGTQLCARCCRVDEVDTAARDRFGDIEVDRDSPPEQQRHHTFLVPETCTLTGFTAEVSAEYNASVRALPHPF